MIFTKNIIISFYISFIVVFLVACGSADDRKFKYLEKGKFYLKGKNLDKARIEFKNALQIDPKFPQAYYYMGYLEEHNKQLRKALVYYKGAIELEPTYIEPKIKVAKIFVVTGVSDYIKKAEELLKDVLLLDSDNFEAKLTLETIEYKSGDKKKAIRNIEELLVKHHYKVEGVSLLATIYSSNDEDIKAKKLLMQGINKNPDDISLRMSYAKLQSISGNSYEVEEQLLKIINISPQNYTYHQVLSKFYSSNNQFKKAEDVLRSALNKNDDDIKRYQGLFEYIAVNGTVEDAERELLAAVSKKPDLYELKFLLSDFYLKLGRRGDSKDVLEELIADKSYDVEAVYAKVKLSSILYNDGDIVESTKFIEDVLKEYPNNNDALLIKSKISLLNGDTLTAINALRTIIKNQPANTDVALLLASAHVMNNDNELAEDVLKRTIINSPNDYKSHYNYVNYLIKAKKYDQAYIALDESLAHIKNNYKLMELKLSLASEVNDEAGVLKILNSMQKYSKNGDVYIKRGKFLLFKKRYTDAIVEFEKAYVNMQDKYQPLDLMVSAYMEQNLADEAIAKLKSLLRSSSSDSVIYHLLGKIYVSNNNHMEARTNFKQSIKLSPKWELPYMELASLYLKNNKKSKAIDIYKEGIENEVNSHALLIQLASLYEGMNKYTESIRLYEKILKSDSRNMMANNNLALLLIENDPDASALARAKEITRKFTSVRNPTFKDTLGWVYVKSGDNESAIKVLEIVVNDAPNVAVYKYHLAVALSNIGDKIKAKHYLKKAIESKQSFVGKTDAVQLLNQL